MQALGLRGVDALDEPALESLACADLTALDLSSCWRVGDASMLHVANAGSKLRTLLLSGCERVGKAGLSAIGRSCPGLQTLALSSSGNLTVSVRRRLFLHAPPRTPPSPNCFRPRRAGPRGGRAPLTELACLSIARSGCSAPPIAPGRTIPRARTVHTLSSMRRTHSSPTWTLCAFALPRRHRRHAPARVAHRRACRTSGTTVSPTHQRTRLSALQVALLLARQTILASAATAEKLEHGASALADCRAVVQRVPTAATGGVPLKWLVKERAALSSRSVSTP